MSFSKASLHFLLLSNKTLISSLGSGDISAIFVKISKLNFVETALD